MQAASSSIDAHDASDFLSGHQAHQHLQTTFATGKTRSAAWRLSQLDALSRLLNEQSDALQAALYEDLGKCKTEAWLAEIGFLLSDIKHTRAHLKRWMKPRKVSTPLLAQPGKSYQIAEPLGCILVIGAWNYPLQLTLAPCIAALAAGNCVLLKPSELAPATSALIKKLIPNYLDNSAITVIEGGKEATSDLLTQPWDHIFYTGGEQVGRIVMRAASDHLTPVTLELGGKSPCLVDRSADIDVTARRIVWGKWMNAGQTCIAPDYVIVEESVKEALLKALKRELKAQYGKQPLQNSDYGKIINARHLQRLQGYLAGHTLFRGGQVDEQQCKMAPTIVLDPDPDSPLMREEIFGPILPVLTTCQLSDRLPFITSRPKPLALYLFTNDTRVEQKIIHAISAGSVCINDIMMFMTNPELPFGGVGHSGMGSYHGKAGFDRLSHVKSVMVKKFWLDVKARYGPFSGWKLSLLKRFL
ncbi:aldehyde dehydrogenase family protein [Salinimonas lutimaris]|uniref:aldehyde dehydrogenase family protein n=1 Tax=Salinimonas lutimaris TaxID=914153 RepID=UPI0010C0D03B|nr:aldehyde dehydrogenase family protein [Salinimonas lutimaris]